MKPIEIYTNVSIEECKVKIIQNLRTKQKSYVLFTPSVLHKNEIVGNIIENNLWLQKTKPKLYTGTSRMFVGNIVNKDEKAVIKGKFVYPLLYRLISFVVIIIIVTIMFLNGLFDINFSIESLFAPLLFAVIIFGYFAINTLIHKKDEAEILNLLRSLFK